MWICSSVRCIRHYQRMNALKTRCLAVVIVIQAHSDRVLKDWVTQLWHPSVAPASRLIICRTRAIILKCHLLCFAFTMWTTRSRLPAVPLGILSKQNHLICQWLKTLWARHVYWLVQVCCSKGMQKSIVTRLCAVSVWKKNSVTRLCDQWPSSPL